MLANRQSGHGLLPMLVLLGAVTHWAIYRTDQGAVLPQGVGTADHHPHTSSLLTCQHQAVWYEPCTNSSGGFVVSFCRHEAWLEMSAGETAGRIRSRLLYCCYRLGVLHGFRQKCVVAQPFWQKLGGPLASGHC